MRLSPYFLMYGGMQAYLLGKVVHAFALHGIALMPAIAFGLLMTTGPLLLWRFERRQGPRGLAVSGAWLVYGWMGFSFLFFWLGLALEVLNLAGQLMHLRTPAPGTTLLVLSLSAGALWLHGFREARRPRVESLVIRSDRLPAGASGLRIVQISDVHLGMLVGMRRLDAILGQVSSLEPDILVSTGDLVDAEARHLDGLSERLAACRPRLGKFAVTGNHEYFVGLPHALAFHERSGFALLRQRSVDLMDGVSLAGVDDASGRAGASAEAALLSAISADHFVILLKHQPLVDPSARFDLQLSGHTHAGQIFPFGLLVKHFFPMIEGAYAVSGRRRLYVSRGTGTWGPPIRILAPPEITLITLQRTQRQRESVNGQRPADFPEPLHEDIGERG